jgi:DNA topoisomerase-1
MSEVSTANPARLVYLGDDHPGLRRHSSGKSFIYVDADGRRIRDKAELARIRALVIPPAWTDVWISPLHNGHLQATGRDARGRKQYRYHPAFRAFREHKKYEHLVEFAEALPAIRRTIAGHIAGAGLTREKVLATIVHLLQITLIRVGNASYARDNNSYGLTTLRTPHVDISGSALRFHFKGKSGKTWRLKVVDRRVAKIVKACHDLPGQHLFQYRDDAGELRQVSSTDVNDYLREISNRDITAKDFRTWFGTVMAALMLAGCETCTNAAAAKRNVRGAVAQVAERLGNTLAICRKCYIHPAVIDSYLAGRLRIKTKGDRRSHLQPEEAAVLAFLKRSLKGPARTPAVIKIRNAPPSIAPAPP